ncbi:TetR/AcrR family transcriptional regulator [Streptomyces fumanus]|uniref:Transcriptional regulator n=1 Tax=Streptomyces fumanus TaxID=67302 RepID=A0A919A8B7_9ACTN|nr:TetR/AcrR family transcriptional regulator [Streptomyces fumanus]GHE92884.1 transcriptional regulator [Streptomyces fumanus]
MNTSANAVDPGKAVREGSSEKRAAILAAARDLFVRQGVDRVSMDAVAARAGVSKRTVYDYFGDKRRLFLAILTAASDSMLATSCRALDEHLPTDARITTVPQLEEALTAFAVDLGTSIVRSPDYAAAFALVAQERLRTPTTTDDLATEAASQELADRIAHFADAGLLDTDDPRLAADHFSALTVLLAYERHPVPATADPEKVRRTMADGVHAFIRAYATRR